MPASQFDGAVHHFQLKIWQTQVRHQPRHPPRVPVLRGSGSQRDGEAAVGQDLAPSRAEEQAAPQPCTAAFYFHGKLEAHRGPGDADIDRQIPGTAAAGTFLN